ncbi:DNA repair protein RecN [Solitalea canadensis]|uniref:DNA repair protein RecN n=1 Tax=Solitalea canadensis (strain ATCC 29591 / DSM 3403 / JCM 21819 / LMG 8368 / NBRC 15130 / NCIMB 12057 / USAM 9D) TaxID=929556 RepID=H8KSP9_SOLCM|nr:DNA repair protein RecN [Solitalea canadensis]AFD05193.1 DNA repair protein RecN [Solitalea canadensis DSM 3403]
MINRLSIRNYAIIDKLDIEFSDHLSIITGETGAGKSIILGALGLILGERADSKSLFKEDQKCVLEGTFNISKYNLEAFFRDNDIDYSNHTIVRREITVDGRSRAFVNDTPVNLSLLKELGEQLIDIHSQHQTLQINNQNFQLQVVDGFAQHTEEVESYKTRFRAYKKLQQKLSDLITQSKEGKAEIDYLQFQFNELAEAKLINGEQEELEKEQQLLSHASEIKSSLAGAFYLLNEGETPILSQLKDAIHVISTLEKYNTSIATIADRLRSTQIELKDVATEIETMADRTSIDPERLELVNARVDLIFRLQQKHRLSSIAELIDLQQSLNTKLNSFSDLDEEIATLSAKIEEEYSILLSVAKKLSAQRSKAIADVEGQVVELLKELGLTSAVFAVENTILNDDQLTVTGLDQIKFLFSANQGFKPQDLSKVASGGELSRLMLAIKGLSAKYNALPTIVFDEIDTGVSGEIARKVGNVMHKYAENMQVITITHLPQIACKGQSHFFVYKENRDGQTSTSIKKLTTDERIKEIAMMLSGENPGESAILNAKELLLQAN